MKKTFKHFFCLFVAILCFGQVWGADTVFKCKLNGSVVQERGDNGTGDFFSITFSSGSYSWKGSSDVAGCTYDDVVYTSALKFDSKPTLSFTTTQSATIIVVMSTSKNSENAPKLDGSAMTSSSSITGAIIWTAENVAAGSHNVKYNSEIWIHCVYVIYPDAGSGSGEEPGDEPGDDPESDTCPVSGMVYSAVTTATGNISIEKTDGLELNSETHKTTVSGGKMYAINKQSSGKNLITNGAFCHTNNDTYFKLELDCALEAGDVISVSVGKDGSNERGVWVSTATSRPSKAPACALTATNSLLVPKTYTVTSTDEYVGKTVLYVYRATTNSTYFNNITITRPYTVSFVSAHGTAPTTPTKAVSLTLEEITGVTGWTHTGWTADKAVKVGDTDKAAGVALGKTATVTLSANTVFTATWEEQLCDGPTITTQPASAHYITGRAATALSCSATAGGEGDLTYTWYSCDNTSRANPVALAGAPTPSTEEEGTFYYYCVVTEEGCGVTATSNVATVTVGEKEKLLLIKVATTGSSNKTVTGYFAKDAAVNLQSDCKFGSGGYMGMMIQNTTFREDDELNVHITTVSTSGSGRIALYSGTNDESTLIYKYDVAGIVGDNRLSLPEDVNERDTLYICRTSDNGWNAVVNYIEVYRAFPKPVLTAITIGGATESTVNQSTKTISLELPAGVNLGSLSVTPTFLSNDPAQTSGAVTSNNGAWVIGANTYVVTDKDGDTETYTINLSEAAAIKQVVISGTLTVVEGSTTTLTASVIDTDDEEAAVQTVIWSVKSGDEALAEVSSAGVVTGKAAGTAHIIATSVADDSKSAEVMVTVTENPCRTWNAPAATFSDETLTIGKLQIVRGDCSASSVQPYKDASNVYGIKIDGNSRFITLSMSDHSQFESLTLGAASGSNGSSPKYVVVASSAEAFAEGDVLSAAEYVANAKDAVQALNEIDLPTGTRYVRVYRKYDDKGDGTSVYLYHVAACKKEFVALTSVAVADKNLAVGVAGAPAITLTPANADVTSYAWEIVSDATGVATINATTGAVSSTAAGVVTMKVTVTDALSNAIVSNIATITIVNKYETVVPVSATQTWDWAPVSVDVDGPTILAPDTVLANYLSGDEWKMLAGAHADRPYRSSTYKAYQGQKLSFKAVVPGILVIYAGRTSSDEKVYVNGHEVGTVTSTKAYLDTIVVPAGDVVITSDGMRIYWMKFDTNLSAYTLEDNMLGGYNRAVTAGNYGTICLPNGGVMVGASIFEIAYFDNAQRKIFFDEVVNGYMVAGRPYIFLPNEGVNEIVVYSTDNANAAAGNYKGLYGSYTKELIAQTGDNYILYNNQYYVVNSPAYVGENRAYLKLSEAGEVPEAPAPGRRRVSMSVNVEQVATSVMDAEVGDQPMKVIINNQLFIIRGGQMYDMTGNIVK